jgi:thioredoxin 1
MALLTITSQTELDAATGKGTSLVDFNAPWCTPCRLQEPILEKIADRFDGRVKVSTVNIDNHPDIAGGFGIHSIPTLIVFKSGKEVQRFVGLHPETALAGVLERLTA